ERERERERQRLRQRQRERDEEAALENEYYADDNTGTHEDTRTARNPFDPQNYRDWLTAHERRRQWLLGQRNREADVSLARTQTARDSLREHLERYRDHMRSRTDESFPSSGSQNTGDHRPAIPATTVADEI